MDIKKIRGPSPDELAAWLNAPHTQVVRKELTEVKQLAEQALLDAALGGRPHEAQHAAVTIWTLDQILDNVLSRKLLEDPDDADE